jgi:hypothetical protein
MEVVETCYQIIPGNYHPDAGNSKPLLNCCTALYPVTVLGDLFARLEAADLRHVLFNLEMVALEALLQMRDYVRTGLEPSIPVGHSARALVMRPGVFLFAKHSTVCCRRDWPGRFSRLLC